MLAASTPEHAGGFAVNTTLGVIGAAGLGAFAMYMLDPRGGRRRRAMVRDRLAKAAHETGDAVEVTARDVVNRARGSVAEMRSWVGRRPPGDDVLQARVRSRVGYLVGHPRSVAVAVQDGRATLSGPVLAAEVDALLAGVSAVRGVREVENRLSVHEEAGDVPGLQGRGRVRSGGSVAPFMQGVWSPTARLVAGVTGGALALWGLRAGGPVGAGTALGGLLLAARGATNLEVPRLIGAGRPGVDVRKAIEVAAPVESVYAFWSRYEHFPRFMSHVRDVARGADGRAHWVVAGPGGLPVEFDTEETRHEPNVAIAWRTVPNALIAHAGQVRFSSTPDGSTRVDLRMAYNPIAGVLGHLAAALFGVDPRAALDEDLARFKSLLEDGTTTIDGRTVRREEVAQ
jgi:uncharacterized membrane protein